MGAAEKRMAYSASSCAINNWLPLARIARPLPGGRLPPSRDKRQRRGFAMEKVLRKVLFAAPSMPVLDLLKEMRITRIHLALTLDLVSVSFP